MLKHPTNSGVTQAMKSNCLLSSGVIILFFFSSPPIILSTASRKSCLLTDFLLFLAAIKAASLHTLAISAPEKPGVCFDKKSTSRCSDFLILFK